MIPHGFAAQPSPSTTTLASEEELTDGLDEPSGEPTEPATQLVGDCSCTVWRASLVSGLVELCVTCPHERASFR